MKRSRTFRWLAVGGCICLGIMFGAMDSIAAFEQSSDSGRVVRDIEFARAGDVSLKLDLYLPPGNGPHPLIVWLHGGAFLMGDKQQIWWRPLLQQTERGYAVASINYRFANQAVFPAQIYDAKAAVRWLRANAETYQLQTDRIIAGGESAGAYLAAMLGVTGDKSDMEDLTQGNSRQSSRVQGVIDFYGPSDFLQIDQGVPESCRNVQSHAAPGSPESQLLGCPYPDCPDKAKQASPITHVSKKAPPFLIFHGTGDCLVPFQQSQIIHEALKKAGVRTELHEMPGLNHLDQGFITPENEKRVNDFIDGIFR